ncbi:helix-turn-helix transcriptional regulator [Ensifer adhaerens]|uniref:helix-turn-helix transcriptional regulator n=2 Tax=Ensifer TaxID=106591 RepID=UPI000DC48C0C|nr:LuxR family transcriptional regulator [Ensifer adhaerens]RAR98484.1 DNA-binding CsgD family transcriptional regulator [Ensifer adhaerens]
MSRWSKGRRQSAALAVLVMSQTIAAAFFVGDAVTDLIAFPGTAHAMVEAMVAAALVLGIVIGGWQLRLALESMREQERFLETARGELARIVDMQFVAWGLTSAESDVGRLALKGLDAPAIARIRNAAPGTVRAQLTRVYAKAGVSGREQFMAWFFEDLMHERLLPPE